VRPARRRPSRTPTAERVELAYRALRPVLRLLRASGLSAGELRTMTALALRAHPDEPTRGSWTSGEFEGLLGPSAQVASAWRNGVRWLDAEGEPKRLALGRDGRGSFAELVQEAAPGADPRRIRDELVATSTVRRLPRGELRLVGRAVVFTDGRRFSAPGVLTHLRRFTEMLEHNVLECPDPADGMLERAVHAADLDPERFAEFNRFIRRQLEEFLLAGDATLREYRVREPSAPRSTYGFGVYAFRDAPPAGARATRAGGTRSRTARARAPRRRP
jgi:hypothetical protein